MIYMIGFYMMATNGLSKLTEVHLKWREFIEMLPSLLAVREISLLEFEELCNIQVQQHLLDSVRHIRWTFLREQITALN